MAAFTKSKTGLTVITGAGISAESGIPTFRGEEGYWTVGSRNYHPEELATQSAFRRMPNEVWAWYLYRRGVCRQADPNPGHLALVTLEERFGERFRLITQNVDGLHLRAGNSLERTYQIHGNINYMRCTIPCTTNLYPIPETMPPKAKGASLTQAEQMLLRCPRCNAPTRPHVLWFDEVYDEAYFRFHSSMTVAAHTGLLIVIGSSGATNLPIQATLQVYQVGGIIVNIDVADNLFSQIAQESGGYFLAGASGSILPELVKMLRAEN